MFIRRSISEYEKSLVLSDIKGLLTYGRGWDGEDIWLLVLGWIVGFILAGPIARFVLDYLWIDVAIHYKGFLFFSVSIFTAFSLASYYSRFCCTQENASKERILPTPSK